MLVWLASYPRSGNHLLRAILKRSFDLDSYEIYQKTSRPLDPPEAALIGARRFPEASAEEFLARARASSELFLVKTHDPVPADDRCIYIVRDGRAALASYEKYRLDVAHRPRSLAQLIEGDEWPGNWQDHVRQFLARDSAKTLVVRYEDIAAENPQLDPVSAFLDRPQLRPFDITFAQLASLDTRRYGTGRNQPGIEVVEQQASRLFWAKCGEAMRVLGYPPPSSRPVEKQKIFFLHLPKCAGTSLWRAFKEIAGEDRVFQVSSHKQAGEFVEMPAAKRADFSVVGGHFDLDFYRRHLDLSRYFCVTTLREPIERLVSEYNYASRNPSHSEHAVIAKLSLDEFIARNSNPLTRAICGDANAALALATLNEVFDRWAFVDDLGALVAEVCAMFGKPSVAVLQMNVGPSHRSTKISPELRARVEQHHGADLELYARLSQMRAARKTGQASLARDDGGAAAPRGVSVFCVVTPCLNGVRYLAETIDSIVSQAGDFRIRYHIQDGGSADGSLELAQQWAERVSANDFHLRCAGIEMSVSSHGDGGMYEAIAAGFRSIAPRPDDIMTWLNADDQLAPGAMQAIGEVFHDLPGVQLAGGRTAIIDADGRSTGPGPLKLFPRRSLAAGLHDGRRLAFVMQEGTFWRAGLWQRTGGVDTRFKLAGDWDLWRRFAAEAEYVALDAVTGYHRRHPGQMTHDLAPYHREVDDCLATVGDGAEVLGEFLKAWSPAATRSLAAFPAHLARREASGRWWLSDGPAPVPIRRVLQPRDGDWTASLGFDYLEGPYPELGVDTPFHWSVQQRAFIDMFSEHAGRRTVVLTVRSLVRGQRVEIRANNGPWIRRRMRGRFKNVETIAATLDFTPGPQSIELHINRSRRSPEGRDLGICLHNAKFEDAPVQRKWWTFGFRAAGAEA